MIAAKAGKHLTKNVTVTSGDLGFDFRLTIAYS